MPTSPSLGGAGPLRWLKGKMVEALKLAECLGDKKLPLVRQNLRSHLSFSDDFQPSCGVQKFGRVVSMGQFPAQMISRNDHYLSSSPLAL